VSPRAAIESRVLVTRRMRPLTVAGRTIHQIGLPYHWGAGGDGAVVQGDSANDLLGVTMDPNVFIQASKSVAGAIMPGRRPRGPDRQDLVEKFRSEAGLTEESGNMHLTVPVEDVAASVGAGRLAEPLAQEDLEVAYGPHGPDCTCDTPMVAGADFRRAEQPSPTTHRHTDDRTGRVDILPGAEAVAEGPAGESADGPAGETDDAVRSDAYEETEGDR